MYVYFIAGHDEYGSEDPRATLDREKVPALLERCIDRLREKWIKPRALGFRSLPFPEDFVRELRAALAEGLAQSDDELAKLSTGYSLEPAWGALHLYVVKLETDL